MPARTRNISIIFSTLGLLVLISFQNCSSFVTPASIRGQVDVATATTPNSELTAAPTPAVLPTTPPRFEWIRSLTGSWSAMNLDIGKIHTPIGWGYMAPSMVLDGDDQYAVTLNSCAAPGDSAFGLIYCGYVVKNGTEVYDSGFNLGNSYSGLLALDAYQPPILLKNGRTLLMAYWMALGSGSAVNLISLDLDQPAPRTWIHRATYVTPSGASFNYLGGAISPNGTIVIAGWAVTNGSYSLQFISSRAPYTSFSAPVTAFASGGARWTPLYPHVVVNQNEVVDLFFTLYNGVPCSEGGTYTAYKNVVNQRCSITGDCQSVWSDAAPDVAQDKTYYAGDNCYYYSARFPLDLLLDEKGVRYFLYRSSDLDQYNQTAKTSSNASYQQKFILKSSSGLNVELSRQFTSFQDPKQIDAMSMTKLSDGRFVIFANSRSSIMSGLKNHINILITKDFQTFEGPYTYSTPFGSGHAIKLAQPNKNGSDSTAKLHFYHGGDLYQRNGSSDGNWGLIEYSQFRFYKATL